MEVASPLPFGHNVQAGSKRRFACSPIVDDTQEAMDESAGYGNPFKRRRCNNNDSDHNAIVAANNGFSSSTVSTTSPFSRPAISLKRQRCDQGQQPESTPGPTRALQKVIEKQTTEIHRLNQINTELSASHDKTLNENKILKRAVTIQQERQNAAVQELNAAKLYRDGAEEKMHKLEQLIASLRYALHQSQTPSFGNWNGVLGNRPPDVY